MIGADGRNNHRVTRDAPPQAGWGALAWSPTGDSIAYTAGGTDNTDLYLIGIDGRDKFQLTATPDKRHRPVLGRPLNRANGARSRTGSESRESRASQAPASTGHHPPQGTFRNAGAAGALLPRGPAPKSQTATLVASLLGDFSFPASARSFSVPRQPSLTDEALWWKPA